MRRCRSVAVFSALCLTLSACVVATEADETDGSVRGRDTTTDTTGQTAVDSGTDSDPSEDVPDFGASTRAQELLGPPVVTVAEEILDLARRADFVRHEVERGQAQSDARLALVTVQAEADRAVSDLESARAELGQGGVPASADAALDDLIAEARQVAREVQVDLDDLDPFVAFDASLENIVQAWAVRGSRSEFVQRLEDLVVRAETIVDDARRLPSSPRGCTDLRTNRIRWASAVQIRTAELRDVAVGGDGEAYDELRDRYDRAPYGEDQTVADAESRACWLDRTSLQDAPQRVDELLSRIEQALT